MRPSADPAEFTSRPVLGSSPPPGPVVLAVWASALRCVLVYVALPALAPALGVTRIVAIPVVLAAYILSIGTALYAIRATLHAGRWPASAVAGSLLALNLLGLVVLVGPQFV